MITLRPDQYSLISSVRAALGPEVRQVLMQAPCGWGKTVTFSWLCEQVYIRDKRVVIVVHREELFDQVSRTLTEFNVRHGFIAAGRYFAEHCRVYVASVWTLAKRIPEIAEPDLVIIDECHHAVAKSWRTILNAWPHAWRLGVTATPERLDGSGLRDCFQALVCGPSVRSLIDAGHLSEFKLYAPPIEGIAVATRAGDYAKEALAAWMDKPKITGSAVAHYKRLASGKRGIVFCVSLDHAAHVAAEFEAAGYAAARIDGGMERSDRHALVARFKSGDIQILTSCEIVSEGFDLPAIECAILLRPTQSLGLYLQQVGRALRPWPGKEAAIILDHAGNALKHGMPDEERDWNLDGQPKASRAALEKVEAIRTCGKCFAASPLASTSCRYCGTVFELKPREIKQIEGELEQITRIEKRKEQRRAQSFDDLVALGQSRGYKNAGYWARKVWASRHS
jgi:DNA repair protein RadD